MMTEAFLVLVRDPRIVALKRVAETSLTVATLAFLGSWGGFVSDVTNGQYEAARQYVERYDWHTALAAFVLGFGAGLVNGAQAYLSITLRSLRASVPAHDPVPPEKAQ